MLKRQGLIEACHDRRLLTGVDTFSQYLAMLNDKFTYQGEDVVTTLDPLCRSVN